MITLRHPGLLVIINGLNKTGVQIVPPLFTLDKEIKYIIFTV
jgi:hypothetical protein